MKNRERLLYVAVGAALVVCLGASTFPGKWFATQEVRITPRPRVEYDREGQCAPEGAIQYVTDGGGHLCVCTRDPDNLSDPARRWRRADGGGECPFAVPILRSRRSAWE